MKKRNYTAVLCGLMLFCCSPALSAERFSLVNAVPEDVFLCTAVQDNPERAFLERYWGEVWDALKATGIDKDFMAMLRSLSNEEQQEQTEQLKQFGSQILEAVDWGKLAEKEFVHAMRMPEIKMQNGGMSVGPPDQVWMFRGAEGSGADNFHGMLKLSEMLIAKLNEAAGTQFAVQQSEAHGARLAQIQFARAEEAGTDMNLTIANRGDVIAIFLGSRMLDQVLPRLGGKGDTKPLAESKRYQEAFAKLPAAEDMRFFFDTQSMLNDVRAIMNAAKKAMGPEGEKGEDRVINKNEDPNFQRLSEEAYVAGGQGDYDRAVEIAMQAHEEDPQDPIVMYNLACFHSAKGETDVALDWLARSVEAGLYMPQQISADPDLEAIRHEPRYREVLAEAAGHAGGDVEAYLPASEEEMWFGVVQTMMDRLLFGTLGMFDYMATVEYTDGYTTYVENVAVMVEDAKRKPFYSVVCTSEPATDYATFLPQETTSFAVNTGWKFDVLYQWILDTIRLAGPPGQDAIRQWEGMQQQAGFNVREDFLSWFQGDTVSATFRLGSTDEWVWMVRVTDEAAAREKLNAGLAAASAMLTQVAQENPMAAMMSVRTAPCANQRLEGFQSIMMQMVPVPMVAGVARDHIMLASSERAAVTVLDTADGKHPNVTRNERVMRQAIIPDEGFYVVSLTDLRNLGNDLAGVVGGINMAGGFIAMAVPDPTAQKVLGQCFMMLGKLVPVVQKIDFFDSSAKLVTREGNVWRTRARTNYVSPQERGAQQPEPTAAQ